MTTAVATLMIGVVVGYLGQRSRMCFIGGIRDFVLVRDTYLLKGLLAFGVTASITFTVMSVLFGTVPRAPLAAGDVFALSLTIAGGFGVGFISTLANGCPFRQHVLAAQGVRSSVAYVAGFLVGAVLFHAWVAPLLVRLLP